MMKLNTPVFLAVSTTFGLFVMLALLFFVEFPIASKEVLILVIGAVVGQWVTIVQYHYGSSSGSAAKTAMLAPSTTETTSTPQKVVTVTSPTPPSPETEKP